MSLAFDTNRWAHVAPATKTELLQSLAFVMVAREIGGCHMFVSSEFENYPYKLFLLLDPSYASMSLGEVADMIHRDPTCRKDRFTKDFLQRFATSAALQSDDCIAVLTSMALVLRCDTSRRECAHAWLRRNLLLKGQTWAPEMAVASADWLLLRPYSGQMGLGNPFRTICLLPWGSWRRPIGTGPCECQGRTGLVSATGTLNP